jgi:hypothetical protein
LSTSNSASNEKDIFNLGVLLEKKKVGREGPSPTFRFHASVLSGLKPGHKKRRKN